MNDSSEDYKPFYGISISVGYPTILEIHICIGDHNTYWWGLTKPFTIGRVFLD